MSLTFLSLKVVEGLCLKLVENPCCKAALIGDIQKKKGNIVSINVKFCPKFVSRGFKKHSSPEAAL